MSVIKIKLTEKQIKQLQSQIQSISDTRKLHIARVKQEVLKAIQDQGFEMSFTEFLDAAPAFKEDYEQAIQDTAKAIDLVQSKLDEGFNLINVPDTQIQAFVEAAAALVKDAEKTTHKTIK